MKVIWTLSQPHYMSTLLDRLNSDILEIPNCTSVSAPSGQTTL